MPGSEYSPFGQRAHVDVVVVGEREVGSVSSLSIGQVEKFDGQTSDTGAAY